MTKKDSQPDQDHKQQLSMVKKSLNLAERSLQEARQVIEGLLDGQDVVVKAVSKDLRKQAKKLSVVEKEKIIEGVFDGQNMIDPDERMYPVPANYASKSKLVEGDVLKLTIQEDGTFVFKQIGPIERDKVIGVVQEDNGEYQVKVDRKIYKVLLASVTYYKAEEGDNVTIIIPTGKESTWAAIENVIKKSGGVDEEKADKDDLSNELEDI